jgi:hypothetical protein
MSDERADKVAYLRGQAKTHLAMSAQAKNVESAIEHWDKHQALMDEADDLRAAVRWEAQKAEIIKLMEEQREKHTR